MTEKSLAAAFVLMIAASSLVGCGLPQIIGVGLSDRCANIMQAAVPSADIEIGKRTAVPTTDSLNKIIARVDGTRTDLPEDSKVPRELAAECEFDTNVLTAFRWTKGGPSR